MGASESAAWLCDGGGHCGGFGPWRLFVCSWHGHIPPDALADEVLSLGLWYRDALCCVEANNHGLTTITQLRQMGYPSLFRRRSLNQATSKVSQEFGWKTTRTTKPLMIDDLSMALRNHESPYDDRVIALALANQMRKFAYAPEYTHKVDDYWTIDWFARLGTDKAAVGEDLMIGGNTRRGTPFGS